MATWTFLTNHGAVLVVLARHGSLTTRRIAEMLGRTERLIQRILTDLEAEGYLSKQRVGRVNHYQLHLDQPLQQSVVEDVTVREMLQGFGVRTRTERGASKP
jgi:DeoR/GlpR family transcriptional regulator of sugar metabolism